MLTPAQPQASDCQPQFGTFRPREAGVVQQPGGIVQTALTHRRIGIGQQPDMGLTVRTTGSAATIRRVATATCQREQQCAQCRCNVTFAGHIA